MTGTYWALAVGVLLLPAYVLGQDVPSGPEKGKAVPALKVFDATGPHEGKEVDYAADRKGKPTVYLFIQAAKWDRPMARWQAGPALRRRGLRGGAVAAEAVRQQ
jgi:hypothetical protein